MATHVLWGSPLYLTDGYCSIYSIHESVGASDQVAVYTVSDCVTNFAHTQLSCFYLLSIQNATKWQSRPRPSPSLSCTGSKVNVIFAHALGEGLGTRLPKECNLPQPLSSIMLCYRFCLLFGTNSRVMQMLHLCTSNVV